MKALTDAIRQATEAIVDAVSSTGGAGGGGGEGGGGGGGLRFGMGGGIMSTINGALEATRMLTTGIMAASAALGQNVPQLQGFSSAIGDAAGAVRDQSRTVQAGQGAVADVANLFTPFALAGLEIPQATIDAHLQIAYARHQRVIALQGAVQERAGALAIQTAVDFTTAQPNRAAGALPANPWLTPGSNPSTLQRWLHWDYERTGGWGD